MKKISLATALLFTGALFAQKQKTRYDDVAGIIAAKPYGYSQVVTTPLTGKLIVISGQTSWDTTGTVIGEGDFKMQLEYCLKSIDKILKAKGASAHNIVKLNYYVKNLDEQKMYAVTEVAKQFFKQDKYPAGCLLGIAQLAHPGFLIEVEATAIVY